MTEEIKSNIQKLIQDFRENYKFHKEHSESNTETRLVEPLFKALGWNEKDWIKQEQVHRGKKQGRADYVFKINDRIIFVLEVKKVGVQLEKEANRQVISYALSKRIPFAISTNFESMNIFCVEQEDAINNKFRVFREPEDYINNFNDLFYLSKESFSKNTILDKAESEGRLKKRVSIDKTLLEDFMNVRKLIANDIEKTYPNKYAPNEKDEIVQRIIDRLIFIRRCEDTGINPDNITLEEINHLPDNKAYPKLKEIFTQYNSVYNSGLFLPNQDNDCDIIKIDGTIIKKLLTHLYESKDKEYIYDFDWIDADVLGQVYEQYLGIILSQTKSGKAQLKDGQAHRKEQGIYYTPTYIVDYIVKNTLGEILKNKKISSKSLKILDPACGSGSFLIKAFDYLSKEVSDTEESKQHKLDIQGNYSIKTEILKNNIYGVDLDNRAVEITKLNLLLKAAERNRKLPEEVDLHVRHGNSLIDDENIAGLNAFKWDRDFKEGTFDVIIGNPPYGADLNTQELGYLNNNILNDKSRDSANYFIAKSVRLLKDGGVLGFIVPKGLSYVPSSESVRNLIINNKLIKILDVSEAFGKDVQYEQIIIILMKGDSKLKEFGTGYCANNNFIEKISLPEALSKDRLLIWSNKENIKIIRKILSNSIKLREIASTRRGLGCNKFVSTTKNEFICLKGQNVQRYHLEGINYVSRNNINQDYNWLLKPKIVAQEIVGRYGKPLFGNFRDIKLKATLDLENSLTLDTVVNIFDIDNKYDIKFILGLLNSKLMSWFFHTYFYNKAQITVHFGNEYVRNVPIPKNITDKNKSKMPSLIDKILFFNKQLINIGDKNTFETNKLKSEIEKLDSEIDNLVYDIYGITDSERKIIENSLE